MKRLKPLTGLIVFTLTFLYAVTSFAAPVTYTYDATNRLIYANDNGSMIEYIYDPVGNLQQRLTRYSVTSDPSSMDFGGIGIGLTSTAQTFTIANAGATTITISTVTLTGTDAASFTVSADACSEATLTPSDTCTVQATFSPSAVGNKSASILISFSSPTALTLSILLSGSGLGPAISASPQSLSFGNVYVTFTSTAQTVTVSNTGAGNLVLGTLVLSGTNAAEFLISSDGCSGHTIAHSGNCTFQVAAVPSAAGQKSASVGIPSNDPVNPSVNVGLSGTAIFSGVKIPRATPVYFTTLQEAYNAAIEGETIQSQAATFTENLNINRNITVTLDGGYDASFTNNTGTTVVQGKITTSSGSAKFMNFKISQ